LPWWGPPTRKTPGKQQENNRKTSGTHQTPCVRATLSDYVALPSDIVAIIIYSLDS
jgi:hypothetical protein